MSTPSTSIVGASSNEIPDILHPLSSLEWEERPSLPVGMVNAQAVFLDGKLHVGGGVTVQRDDAKLYSCQPNGDGCWTATDTPTYYYALTAYDFHLVLVGGIEYPSEQITNNIYTMVDGEFKQVLPSMIEKRASSSAVSSGTILAVAGGWGSLGLLSFVEVYSNEKWTTKYSLPVAAGFWMKTILHGDKWVLLGGTGQETKVYCVSLQSLISETEQEWDMLANIPFANSAAALLGRHILSLGGIYPKFTSAIHAYSANSQSWMHVADLPTPLGDTCTIVLPTGELMVIGGDDKKSYKQRVFRAFIRVPLVHPDVNFSLPKLFQLHNYGIKLIDELSKDRFRFHATSGVKLLKSNHKKAASLSPKDYVELVFKAWKINKQCTYPPTWDSLFSVLTKMDLGHLTEQIGELTGSVPAKEPSSAEPVMEEVVSLEGEKEDTGDREELILNQKAELKNLKIVIEDLGVENDQLADENDQLLEENDKLMGENDKLIEENEQLKAENVDLRRLPVIMQEVSTNYQPWVTSLKQEEAAATTAVTTDLRGIEVVGRTSVMVTNSEQSFHWRGYGFKLHIPTNSLPAGVNRCFLHIIASVAGQYQFPDNNELVSAVFWVRSEPLCRFQQPLTADIQHCANMTSSTNLTFVRAVCSQKNLPYTFKVLEGQGSFSVHSSYGSLQLDHFSGIAVIGENVERLYTASLYYLGENPRNTEIHLVITWDEEVHVKDVKLHYQERKAREGSYLGVEFEQDKISLDIPMQSGVAVGGWKICPLIPPILFKKRVDSFRPGQRIPSLQLRAKPIQKEVQKISELSYLINLQGAREPNNVMVIEIEPLSEPVSTMEGAPPLSLTLPGIVNPESALSVPGTRMSGSSVTSLAPYYPRLHHHQNSGYLPIAHSSTVYPVPYTTMPGPYQTGGLPNSFISLPEPDTVLNPGFVDCPSVTIDQLVNIVGISKDLLDQTCSTEHLMKIASRLPNWQKYAESLRLSDSQVQDIKTDPHLDTAMKAQRVLKMWHQANGFKASHRSIVDVSLQLKHVAFAESICRMVKETTKPQSEDDLPEQSTSKLTSTGEKRKHKQSTITNEEEQVSFKKPRTEHAAQ